MRKMDVSIVLALTFIWIILVESLTWITVVSGLIFSTICVVFIKNALPLEQISGINLNKLATYPFYLLWSAFYSAYYVAKMIIFGARVDIVDVKTKLKNETLKVILADSITLTPGSTFLDLEDGDIMKVLWLRRSTSTLDEDPEEEIISGLENKLMKAEVS